MWKIIGVVLFLLVLSIYDIRSREVPIRFLAVGSLLAVIYAIIAICGQQFTLGGQFAALAPGAFFLLSARVTGKIGYGDGWLLLIIGLFMGYRECMAIFFISLFLIGLASAMLLLLFRVSRNSCIPYIPFLTLSVLIRSFM